jgi:hypothetical protein
MMPEQPAPQAGFFVNGEDYTAALRETLGLDPPGPEKRYDVKIKRCTSRNGKLRAKVVPREDFLMDRMATVLDENVRFCGQRIITKTRSELKLIYPDKAEIIDELPAYSPGTDKGLEKSARHDRFNSRDVTTSDKSTELIEYFETYPLIDYDGDGIAERRQVVVARGADNRHLLSNIEWGGDIPFTDIVPDPMPHRWEGRSVFDETYDIQRVKTVLMRQTLDNLYQVNNPMQAMDVNRVENPDAVFKRELSATVLTKGPPGDVIVPFVVPFAAKDSFPVLEYMDMVAERRTGIGRASMALDPDALQNQTATAVQATQDIKFSKVEVYARNIAEAGGLKRLFKCMLKLFVENQREPMTIRLRGEFVDMDPKGWNADMDCTVNVGLGAGSRDRDMAMLQNVLQVQQGVIAALQNPFNPILNLGHALDTARRLAEAAGLKSPEQYFPEVSQEQIAQIKQQMDQNPPPNPEAAKAQAQMQIEQMKLQANMQLEQARMQADAQRDAMKGQLDQQAMAQKAEIEKIQAQADIATQQQKVEAEIMLARERFALEAALKREEHAMRMQEMQAESARKDREFEMRAYEAQQGQARAQEAHGQKLEQMEAAAKNKPKAKDE